MSDEFRSWSAAYVLGALDADERAEFETHLRDCEACRAEVAELAPIPGLLARTSPPGDEDEVEGALGLALAEVASERRRLARARRVWQFVAAGAAAAVVVLVLFLALDDPTAQEAPTGERVELAVASETATAEIGLVSRPWGSVVDIHVIEVDQLPQADSFTAWVVDGAGRWEPACTWGLDGDGWAKVQGASSIPVDQVVEVVITATDDRSQELLRGVPTSS